MSRLVGALAAVALSCATAQAQNCGAGLAGAQALQAAQYTLVFRTQPAPVAVGKHFAIELVVCPKAGAATPQGVKVDAYMPEHRHGMNYKPAIKALGDGRFRADGLMFHMPGRWEFRFDVENQGQTERLTSLAVVR